MRIVSVEAVAEKWLLPRLASFKAAHPGIAIELETNHRGVDPSRRDFDAWFACSGETSAPRPLSRREDTLLEETLYKELLLPVCSPALLAARGRPRGPAELRDWPLLYDLGWDADWSYWFARQGEPTPDLSRASGFRLYSMLVQAAANGLGAAIGRPMLIAHELEKRILVPLFDRQEEAPERCCLITTAASRQRPELQAFREWILREARAAMPPPGAVRHPQSPGIPVAVPIAAASERRTARLRPACESERAEPADGQGAPRGHADGSCGAWSASTVLSAGDNWNCRFSGPGTQGRRS